MRIQILQDSVSGRFFVRECHFFGLVSGDYLDKDYFKRGKIDTWKTISSAIEHGWFRSLEEINECIALYRQNNKPKHNFKVVRTVKL